MAPVASIPELKTPPKTSDVPAAWHVGTNTSWAERSNSVSRPAKKITSSVACLGSVPAGGKTLSVGFHPQPEQTPKPAIKTTL